MACALLSMLDILFPGQLVPSQFVLGLEVPFAIELAIRFSVFPNRHIFWFDVYNFIDLLVILASALPRTLSIFVLEGEPAYAAKIFSPLLVLLRLLRRFEYLQLLTTAFAAAAQVV